MKNKTRLFDFNTISTYMGKMLTVSIAVFVFAVAVSALIHGGASHNIIRVCVAAESLSSDLQDYEPLRVLLAGETRRPVVLTACEWSGSEDLYVLPLWRFMERREAHDLQVIAEIVTARSKRDAAVLVARSGEDVRFAELSANEVAFTRPTSPNGYWLPCDFLASEGVVIDAAAARFEGAQEDTRVVLGVLFGRYRVGACRQDDINRLVRRGVVAADEIKVVYRTPALPEFVVAARSAEADYYRGKVQSIERMLQDGSSGTSYSQTVHLLQAAGVVALQPIDPIRLQSAAELFERYRSAFDRVSP